MTQNNAYRLKTPELINATLIIVFSSAFAIFGLVIMVYSVWSGFAAYQAKSWPAVTGRVLEAECKDAGENATALYIKYEYTIAAQRYVNDRETFGIGIAGQCFAGYSTGESIAVFYDPADPKESVLKPGVYRPAWFSIIGGLLFMAFGIYAIYASINMVKKQKSANAMIAAAQDQNWQAVLADEEVVKNKILLQMPTLQSEHFIYDFPVWQANILRVVFGLFSIGCAVMFAQKWTELPIGFKGLAIVLVPAFFFIAVHPKMNMSKFYFLADHRGLFFPLTDGTHHREEQKNKNWLLVPWQNIANLRTALTEDTEGDKIKAIAFDMRVTPQEKEQFFKQVDCPLDRKQPKSSDSEILFVAYRCSQASLETLLNLSR